MTDTTTPLTIRVNGKPAGTAALTVALLLAERGIDASRPGIAVAVNRKVVPRKSWADAAIAESDDIEIVQPFSGG